MFCYRATADGRCRPGPRLFYRTSGGAEIDLLLVWPDGRLWAIEIKHSLAPKVERGYHAACEDLQPEKKFAVYPGQVAYPMAHDIEAIPLAELAKRLDANSLI